MGCAIDIVFIMAAKIRSSKHGTTRSRKNHIFNDSEVSSIQKFLLNWYDSKKRDLPWRKLALSSEDPNLKAYAVWVSEVMLQQTQVVTVTEYYQRWMKRWPTVQDLAQASCEEVREMWAGLGYYRRAERLWEGACKVVNELKGEIPRTASKLTSELPGVGQYTAGAIASIAFGQPVGVLDGNVMRVLCRMRSIGASLSKSLVTEHLWSLAHRIADSNRPGDLNQSLMELGACVCLPRGPTCNTCPVKEFCTAHLRTVSSGLGQALKPEGTDLSNDVLCIEECQLCLPKSERYDQSLGVMNYPRKAPKRKPKVEEYAVAIVTRGKSETFSDRELLIVQRADNGLLAGMWEFPSKLVTSSDNVVQSLLQEICQVHEFDQKTLAKAEHLGEVTHFFSHVHHCYQVYHVPVTSDASTVAQREVQQHQKWVDQETFSKSAVSTGMKKVYKLAIQSTKDITATRKRSSQAKESSSKAKQRKLDTMWKK